MPTSPPTHILRLIFLCAFLPACSAMTTLESARVVERPTVSVEASFMDGGYSEPTDEIDAEPTRRILPYNSAIMRREPSDDKETPTQFEFGITSSGLVMAGGKFQWLDLGPLAGSIGFKIGTDIITFVDIIANDDDDTLTRQDSLKSLFQFGIPAIFSIHPFDGLELYAAGRFQFFSTGEYVHAMTLATAGTCIGTQFGVCGEVTRFESVNTDFDGYMGAVSLKVSFDSDASSE